MGQVARDVPAALAKRRQDLIYALSLFGILTFGAGATLIGVCVLVVGIALFVVGVTRW